MVFLIEGIVIFNSESRELYSTNSELNNTVLSNYAARALELLILNNGNAIERGLFFQFLWGDNETNASNASLNNYVSEVRKALMLLGVNKAVITTLPKYGFKLVADVEIEPTDARKISSDISVRRKLKWRKRYILIPAIMICLTILSGGMFRTQRSTPDVYLSFSQGACNFYILNSPRISIEEFKDVVNKENIECNKNPRDVFMTETREYGDVYNIRLIAVCDRIGGKYSDCVNIKRVFTNHSSDDK